MINKKIFLGILQISFGGSFNFLRDSEPFHIFIFRNPYVIVKEKQKQFLKKNKGFFKNFAKDFLKKKFTNSFKKFAKVSSVILPRILLEFFLNVHLKIPP